MVKHKETDNGYFLKLVLYLIIGSQWVFITDAELTRQIPLPVGLLIGLVFAAHDHFQLDRKIEYALLLIATFIGFWSGIGINLSVL